MKQKKKNTLQTILIILLILGLILTAVIAGILLFGTKSESRLRRQLSLGERYYNDLDYDRAIAAYDEALEIDPKMKRLCTVLLMRMRTEVRSARRRLTTKAVTRITQKRKITLSRL